MKNLLLLTTALAALTATTASADEVVFTGYIEYALAAQTVNLNLGTEVYAGAFTVAPSLDFAYAAGAGTFEGINIDVAYTLTANANVYLEVDFDNNAKYQEATVGVAFHF